MYLATINLNVGESMSKMILPQFIRVNKTVIDPNIKKFLFTRQIFSN